VDYSVTVLHPGLPSPLHGLHARGRPIAAHPRVGLGCRSRRAPRRPPPLRGAPAGQPAAEDGLHLRGGDVLPLTPHR
jgi:hypothetical protein